MTIKYYIPKCFVKGLKEKKKHFETLNQGSVLLIFC